jgi:uncharacterized protein (DUF1800 family)
MRSRPEKLALFLLVLSLACAVPQLLAKKKDKDLDASPEEQKKRAVHALNRLTFGPRPEDVQQVMAMGVDRWIDLQLHPEKINDEAIEARLAAFRTLRMSPKELAENFPDGQMVKQVMAGKMSMPSDPARRAVFQVQIARQEEKKERKEEAANSAPAMANNNGNAAAANDATERAQNTQPADRGMNTGASNEAAESAPAGMGESMLSTPPSVDAKPSAEEQAEARHREEKLYADLEVSALPQLPPEKRYKKILSMTVEQKVAFADSLRGGKGQDFLEGLDPRQKETLLAMNNPQGVFSDELMQAKLLRAIYSERQLEEVMTDFWFNHFNVFIGNYGPYRYPPRMPRPNANRKQNLGLNENYGRELLELHTLSVNGGYSQRDVTETAKVFTGWTIDKPFQGGGFEFDPRKHEPGPKFVLGHRIKPKGEGEGMELLHRLATSPQTAHFISLKLAERFVSDNPPPALVDSMAKTFLKKKGEIREVLLTMFHSPEFWAGETYRAKVKTPLEFVASAVRATGGDVTDAMPLVRQLNNMGMPLYGAQPPTGYSMKAETWVSSSALLNRMNFSLGLTSGKIKGVTVNVAQVAGGGAAAGDSVAALSVMENAFLAGDVSKQTHDSIAAQAQAPPSNPAANKKANAETRTPDVATIAGLLLGSPEFQRR